MSGIARARLTQERKAWRKDHPKGFVAKPVTSPDGSQDLLRWECKIPGEAGTIWEGGQYPLDLEFSENYPATPPVCRFPPNLFHPNVFSSGQVCLSIINSEKGWKPSITVSQILVGIQKLLDQPNNEDAAHIEAHSILKSDPAKYSKLVREQAAKYRPAE